MQKWKTWDINVSSAFEFKISVFKKGSKEEPCLIIIFLAVSVSKNQSKFKMVFVLLLKFMFSKKATKIDEILIFDLKLCSKCQIDGEDLINFCGLLRKHEL